MTVVGRNMVKQKLAVYGGTPVRSTPLGSPHRSVGQSALDNLRQVLESGQLNKMGGIWVSRLEERFAQFYGAQFCTASTSGTAAIHLAVGALNPEPGDEIITTPISDMGTIIPILAQNAIPVFADVQLESGNLDPYDVERCITSRTRAIIAVHLGGSPCDVDRLCEIAEKHNLMLIEDCSQAYCATYKGKRVGLIGDVGCFSMQQSKHLTAGDGGLTITNNPDLGEKTRLFADKGWPNYSAAGARDYQSFGFNYRMTELQGAVGVSALEVLPSIVERRIHNGNLLTRFLEGVPGVYPQRVEPNSQSVYWSYFVRLVPEEIGAPTKSLCEAIHAEGIPCGYQYIGKPLFMYDALRRKQIYGASNFPFSLQNPKCVQQFVDGQCPNCEKHLNQLISIAVHEVHSDSDIKDIADAISKVVESADQLSQN